MSGLHFLRSAIENGARSEFRQVRQDLFVGDEETQAFQFVSGFQRRHGTLPSLDVCLEEGHNLPSAPNPPGFYLERMRSRAIFNSVTASSPELASAMRSRDAATVVQLLQAMSQQVGRFEAERDLATLSETLETVMEEYAHAHRNPGMQGITLGWPYLDGLTNGAEPGDVVTYVARPGMGKSWLMTHCSRAAWLAGASVLFVTMEMTGPQIARRFVGLDAGVNPDFVRRGQLSMHGMEAVVESVQRVQNGPPFRLMTGSFDKSVPMVDAAIQEFAPDIVFIDASYLMAPAVKTSRMAAHELIANVGKEVKEMALARRKPVVQSVQFNREAAKAKKRGTEHIGGSDAVSQISTIIIGIDDGEAPDERTKRRLSVIKNREGDAGDFQVNFLFSPPNFDYIPSIQEEAETPGSEFGTAVTTDTGDGM